MAAWDALAKAAEMPLAVYLGGSLAPVPAYNSNGLWLTPLDGLAKEAEALVAEGGFAGLKLRLGRERIDGRPRRDPRWCATSSARTATS